MDEYQFMFKGSITASEIASRGPGEFVSRAGLALVVVTLIGLTIPTGLVAMLQGSGGLRLPFNLFVVDARLPGIFRLHMLASGLSLLVIPLAIYTAKRRLAWHRALGVTAAICVVLGALTSLPVAIMSTSVGMARAGFFAQGLVWIALLAAGITAIRARRVEAHARCMLAMAGVASGAIWVRLTTTAATAWDLPFDTLYACAAWGGWIIPLVVAWGCAPRLIGRG